jgi:hypothetical protein
MDPICFQCQHFRQYQPLSFLKPGDCGWQPDAVPAWLEPYINSDDYYAPKREIWSRGHIIEHCQTFAKKAESGSTEATG